MNRVIPLVQERLLQLLLPPGVWALHDEPPPVEKLFSNTISRPMCSFLAPPTSHLPTSQYQLTIYMYMYQQCLYQLFVVSNGSLLLLNHPFLLLNSSAHLSHSYLHIGGNIEYTLDIMSAWYGPK